MGNVWDYVIYSVLLGAGLGGIGWSHRVLGPRRDWWVLAAACLAMGGFLIWVSYFQSDWEFSDFDKAYYAAGQAVLAGDGSLAAAIDKGFKGFVNVPIVAWFFAPLGALSMSAAEVVFTALGLAAVLAAWWIVVRLLELDRLGRHLSFFLVVANGPLHYSIAIGNATHHLLLLLAGAWYLSERRRDFAAGLLLGLAALLKLPLGLFGVYYVLRRRWGIVAGGAVVLVGSGLLSLAVFGWDLHVRWYEASIKPFSDHGMAACNVQTAFATLMRIKLGPIGLEQWSYRPIVGKVGLASTLALWALYGAALVAMCRRPRVPDDDPTRTRLEFLLVLGLAVLGGKLAWSHYYLYFLLPAMFVLKHRAALARADYSRWMVCLGLWLAAQPEILLFWEDHRLIVEAYSRFGVSRLFLGGVLVFAALVWWRWRGAVLPPVGSSGAARASP